MTITMKMNVFFTFCLIVGAFFSCKKEEATVPPPSITITDLYKPEKDGFMEFEVKLSTVYKEIIRVEYATADGTAIAGKDYTTATGSINFPVGETVKKIRVNLIDNDLREVEKVFSLALRNASGGATFDRSTARGYIQNDDTNFPALSGYTTPETYSGKTLVWRDEFDGTALNTAFWTPLTGRGNGGWGNNELQFYRAENTTLQQGYLVIEARQERVGDALYTSSRLVTKGKKAFRYGRIDIRALLPKGQGIWPALWMLGENIDQVNWPACGEIDIMELVGHEAGVVHGTAHYGATFAQHGYKGKSTQLPAGKDFSQEFHVFSINWEENKIVWLMDDQPFFQLTPADIIPAPWPFNLEHHFLFNVAVGGNWPGNPNSTTVFPQHMLVDYVRVFQ
jgi:beta-glucanase (GH16 family)